MLHNHSVSDYSYEESNNALDGQYIRLIVSWRTNETMSHPNRFDILESIVISCISTSVDGNNAS